jgi:hypothetical protein
MTTYTAPEFLVASCSSHGDKVCADYPSFRAYVAVALDCDREVAAMEDYSHDHYHAVMGHDCWVCCPLMVVDPHGILDH